MYDLARSAFGGQHVVVAPLVFGGRRCTSGTDIYRNCPAVSHGGIAGIVVVPLIGAGGGHSFELWPRVQTDDVADGFYQFDKQFRLLRDKLTGPLGLPDASQASDDVLLQRFNTLAPALDSVLARLSSSEGHSYYAEDMEKMRTCLALLTSAPVLPAAPPTGPPRAPPTPAESCQAGMSHDGKPAAWTMAQKLSYLNQLWQQYDLLVDAEPIGRHNLLIGPLAGVSITDKAGDLLYGAGLEAGWKSAFRFTAAVGWRSSMSGEHLYLANMDRVGWWVGIGLSGQLGDELIDGLMGVNRIFTSGTGGSN
jgi:hypothetical protein